MNKLQGFVEYVVYPFFRATGKNILKIKESYKRLLYKRKGKKERRKDKEGKNTKQSREMQGSKFTEMTAIN